MNVIQVRPPGYIHAEGLTELAETVRIGGQYLNGTVVIGAHLGGSFPADAIFYNSEVVEQGTPWMSKAYFEVLKKHCVWDYDRQNVARLKAAGINAKYVPIGYVPELARIVPGIEDIDVLFVGSINLRRQQILDRLRHERLIVKQLFGCYGMERDGYIARAKVLLNLHFYSSHVFEIVRVSYYLANGKAVVAEIAPDTSIDDDIREAVAGCPYDRLVEMCLALVHDKSRRRLLEIRGHALFARRNEAEILRQALATSQDAQLADA